MMGQGPTIMMLQAATILHSTFLEARFIVSRLVPKSFRFCLKFCPEDFKARYRGSAEMLSKQLPF